MYVVKSFWSNIVWLFLIDQVSFVKFYKFGQIFMILKKIYARYPQILQPVLENSHQMQFLFCWHHPKGNSSSYKTRKKFPDALLKKRRIEFCIKKYQIKLTEKLTWMNEFFFSSYIWKLSQAKNTSKKISFMFLLASIYQKSNETKKYFTQCFWRILIHATFLTIWNKHFIYNYLLSRVSFFVVVFFLNSFFFIIFILVFYNLFLWCHLSVLFLFLYLLKNNYNEIKKRVIEEHRKIYF
jgi:hypothetical protein